MARVVRLLEEVRFDTEKVTSRDWASHPTLRHADVPEQVDIVLVNGDPIRTARTFRPTGLVRLPGGLSLVFRHRRQADDCQAALHLFARILQRSRTFAEWSSSSCGLSPWPGTEAPVGFVRSAFKNLFSFSECHGRQSGSV